MINAIETESLSSLGSHYLDVYDESVRCDDDYDMLYETSEQIASEIFRRIGRDKVRPMMDFHYKAWADSSVDERMNRFYEFKALQIAFDEMQDAE